jgi:uncharacterized tellurite resistance protein B-like protein
VLSKLARLLDRHLTPGGDTLSQPLTLVQKQLAMAALLVEVALADHHFDPAEFDHLLVLLERKFSLPLEERTALAELAKTEAADATSLHQFTQLVNRECTHDEKFTLVKAMWELAYADGQLDKYEEYVIRKVADLIHVSHSDFIRAKSLVKAELINSDN